MSEVRAIPLFAGLAEDALRDLAIRVQRREYSKGKVILRAGDAPREMHIVLDGRCASRSAKVPQRHGATCRRPQLR